MFMKSHGDRQIIEKKRDNMNERERERRLMNKDKRVLDGK
jgi:hypothetical protein